MFPPVATIIVSAAVLSLSQYQGFALDTCSINREFLEVEPNADVTIGAILPVHEAGDGIYGCGAPSVEGIEIFESLRWAIKVLNQDNGLVNGQTVSQSFIPGVKIGLKAYDSCGHSQLAVRQMTDLLPVLKTGSAMCWTEQKNSSVLGIMDLSGSIFEPRVAESLRRHFIPSVSLAESTATPPDHIAKMLAEVVHDMEWKRVAVLYVDDEYSIHVVKLLGQVALAGRLCFAAVESIPGVNSKSNNPELRSYHRALNLVTTKLPENMGVIVIGHGEPIRRLLRVMAEVPETVTRLQWLFSWVPDPAAMGLLGELLNSKRVFSLGPYPAKISALEDHWANLQDLATGIHPEDRWFLEYVMARKHCRVPGMPAGQFEDMPLCANLGLREMPADAIWRTSRSLAALHAVFTFAHALQKAWEDKCQGESGFCAALQQLSQRDFVAQYLEPLEFEHDSSARSPPEMSGRKTQTSQAGEIEGIKLALTQYNYDKSLGVGFRQVVAYDMDKAEVLDSTFGYLPSMCPHDGCGSCVKVREGRGEGSSAKSTQGIQTIGSPQDHFIPVMLPLHVSSNSPLECGSTVNPSAVQELEAALWMVDRINSDQEFLPGVHLGIVAIDTCFSSIKATEHLSSFLSERAASTSSVDLEDAIAFVSSSSAEETVSASAVLSPINISVVAVKDITIATKPVKLGYQYYSFQVSVPLEERINAAVEMLKYLGWRFVSVLHSDGAGHKMVDTFRKVIKDTDLCMGFVHSVSPSDDVEKLDSLLTQLKQTSEHGAKAVILLTDEPSTRTLFDAIKRTKTTGFIRKGDFVWLVLSDWADRPYVLKDYEEELEGALLFQAQHSAVRDFETYYKRLQPDSNKRNPWFTELWHQMSACSGPECPSVSGKSMPMLSNPTTVDTMQAVLVVASALARLRNELCRSERGICSRLLMQPELRHVISQYIQYTASMKPDADGEMFTFSLKGYGNRPIEIANLRRSPGNSHAYQKVAVYSGRLVNTAPMVSYGPNDEEMPLDHVTSECISSCSSCKRRAPDFLVLDSADKLYIAATFGIHKQAENPLQCGQLLTSEGLQNMEAFLWALDQINNNQQLLPGIKLGSVIFDTCGSPQRASRDVPSFFSRTLKTEGSDEELSISKRVVAFISSQGVDVVQPVVDLTMSLKIPTVAPQATSSSLNDVHRYPYLLRLSLPNNVLAQGLTELLKHFQWTYVSVVYSKDRWYNEDAFENFQKKAEMEDIKLALVEAVPDQSANWNTAMDTVINRLKIKQQEGARAVVILLNSEQLTHLLAAAKRLHEAGQIKVGDFVWLVHDNREIFHQFTEQSLGALSLMTTSGIVPDFQKYFQSLSLRNNTRNPWFREYWEQVFNCRGAACYNGLNPDLRSVAFMQDQNVPSTINSLFALAHGLENTRRSLCPGQAKGLCASMMNHGNLGELIMESIHQVSFLGADGRPVKFTNDNYLMGNFDIANFRQVGSNAFAFVGVGKYSEVDGLTMNMTKVRGYNQEGHEINLQDIISQCNHSDACPRSMSYMSPTVMQVMPSHEFSIASLMAVHQKGNNLFTCGPLDKDIMFQNLVAFAYALDKVNSNASVLPQLKLGGIVFDYCDSKQRAEEKLFEYFSKNDANSNAQPKIKPKSLISLLSYDVDVAEEVSPILETNTIPQITNPSASDVSKTLADDILIFKPVPSAVTQADAIVALLKYYNWKYISLIYADNKFGLETKEEFLKKTREAEICVSEALLINLQSSQDELSDDLQSLMDPLVHVIVVLVDNAHLTRAILTAAKELSILDRYVWIGTQGLSDLGKMSSILNGVPTDIFAVKLETYVDKHFPRFFSGLTLGKHDPIPTPWFEEFWQHHFRCQLPNSMVIQRQYPSLCSGQERIQEESVSQNDFIHLTIRSVESVAKALHNYLRKYCLPGDAAMSIEDCGLDAKKKLSQEIGNVVMGQECDGNKCKFKSTPLGYQILQLRNTTRGTHAYVQVGLWKDDDLALKSDSVAFVGGIIPQSLCYGDCRKCSHQIQGEALKEIPPRQPLFQNFRTVWGIVATALSILGIILVIICVLYFLMAFPVTVGTTVLGYMILFGLLVLYAVNFAFIFPPTECTCGVRRFVMGLAYAIVFSGMLVKVMNTWRLMGYNGNRMMHDGTRLSSPAGLLVVAVGLVIVQIVLTAAWLILMPPKLGIYDALWRCAPPDVFEEELIISLIYVMLLLAATILFSILTWHCQDNNGESRWILACCLFVGIAWVAWTVLSTLLPLRFRDLTIVAANLICASLVMLCLYMRKVYLYSKLTRQARDREMKAKLQPSQYQTPVYGTLHKNAPLGPVLYGSQASLNNRKIFSSPARNSVEGQDDDTHSGSSGSVQVQATDLYPLEMYDGGCQFQPSNSIYTSKGMVILDDGPTFVR